METVNRYYRLDCFMNKGTTDEKRCVGTREYYGQPSYDGHRRCSLWGTSWGRTKWAALNKDYMVTASD